MKKIGIATIFLSLVIGIVPLFTECLAMGRVMTLANGMTAPMRCHWTAMAEMALAVPLLGLGTFMTFSRQRETRLSLSTLGVILGVFAILIPTVMIGVCPDPSMMCNMVMRPTLVLSGIIISAMYLGTLAVSMKAVQQPA